jgi:hypothetical protein
MHETSPEPIATASTVIFGVSDGPAEVDDESASRGARDRRADGDQLAQRRSAQVPHPVDARANPLSGDGTHVRLRLL